MAGARRPRVWLVDDRAENRERFKKDHGAYFDVDVFETPDEVLKALAERPRPDALLCDIYFYPDARQGDDAERRVLEQARELEALGDRLGARAAETGIELIRNVRERYRGDPPFPIYAYTSKGPYIMQSAGFQRLEELEARWLFKKRYTPESERLRIIRDIEALRAQRGWRRIWKFIIASGAVGALIGFALDRLAKYWFRW